MLVSLKNQRMFYHISNIRAIHRIGPHNGDVLSVIKGSLLGWEELEFVIGKVLYTKSIYSGYMDRGYTSNLQPSQYTRTLPSKEGKVYHG